MMSDRPQLKNIALALSKLKWSEVKSVAVQLGMDLHILSQIEERYTDLSERTLHSMQAWLQNSLEPSWAEIAAALRAIELYAVARGVEQQYCQSVETPPISPAATGPQYPPPSELTSHPSSPVPISITDDATTCAEQPSPPTDCTNVSFANPDISTTSLSHPISTCSPRPIRCAQPNSPPPLPSPPQSLHIDCPVPEGSQPMNLQDAQQKVVPEPDVARIKQVVEKTSQLHEKFLSVLTNTKIYLSEKESESRRVLNRLCITLTTLPLSYKFQHLHFLRSQEERIQNARSISELFSILDKHWNWSDYYLLQRLIANFGDDSLKQEMTTYVVELEEFEKATTILLFRSATKHWEHPYYFSKAVIMLQKDASECTLYDIRKLKEDLASKSSLNEAAIYYDDVHASLVVIEIVFPQDALELILPVMDAAFLEQHHIISVTIDERPLEEYDENYVKGLQLRRVCREGDNAAVTSLLHSGVDPNFRTIIGWTALHIASFAGQAAAVALLLDYGADVHAVDEYQRTPLHVASDDGTVQLLLDRGADPNTLDHLGRSALVRAAEKGRSHTVEVLVQGGANPNIQDEYDGLTGLMLATLEDWPETVSVLLQCGADPNVQNKEGLTALMVAAKEGQTAIVNTLVEGHADINIQENSTSWSALFFAAREGDVEIAKKLIEAGAEVFLKDQNGVTALDVARVHDRERVCELLSKTMTPPVPLTTPLSKEANLSTQQTTPATPEERRHTFETLRNLVNKSGQRITEMYRQVKKRLKSTTEKELFQKKVAGNQDDTLENTHIMPEEHKKITLCTK